MEQKPETKSEEGKRPHSHHPRGGTKRDRSGQPKKNVAEVPRNAYTSMFEAFRDEIDEHHDRRERIVKVSRDITALSKKMIFTLLRTRTLSQPLPPYIEKDFFTRLAEIRTLLASIAVDIQGINRHRYQIRGLEEFVEAASLHHYLRHQALITPDQASALLAAGSDAEDLAPAPAILLTTDEYLGGIFDLFGEMMRFATNMAGLRGTLTPAEEGGKENVAPGSGEEGKEVGGDEMDVDGDIEGPGKDAEVAKSEAPPRRSILSDMQELESCVEILPFHKSGKSMSFKTDTMRSSVQKVERLGYGLVVRGSERPAGWMPDLGGEAQEMEAC